MHDEGYIKFESDWTEGPSPSWYKISALAQWRQRLHEAGLIGAHTDGVGFGNISVRDSPPSQFLITGTTTGHIKELGPEHFTRIVKYDFDRNRVSCLGPHYSILRNDDPRRFLSRVARRKCSDPHP